MVAQVFNLCTGGVLLSLSGTGFQPVNPLRIVGAAGLNYRGRDGIRFSNQYYLYLFPIDQITS